MAIGERIRFFRSLRGMTQKGLGIAVGFPEQSADVRIAQYESSARSPKADLTRALARALDISPQALEVPDIDSETGLMHTLFALEDIYGLTVGELEGEVCLRLDRGAAAGGAVPEMLASWREKARKLEAGELSREAYDRWRYGYPPRAEASAPASEREPEPEPEPAPEPEPEPELNPEPTPEPEPEPQPGPEPEPKPEPQPEPEPEPQPEPEPEPQPEPEPEPKPASPAQNSGNRLAEILKRYII